MKEILVINGLIIKNCIKITYQTKLLQRTETKRLRRWVRALCTDCFLDLIPTGQHSYNTQSLAQVETHYRRADHFNYSFFPVHNSCVEQT